MKPVGLLGVAVWASTIVVSAPAVAQDEPNVTKDLEPTRTVLKQAQAVAKEVDDASDKTGDFDRMRTPDSPAFVILGISPTDIQRPGTPKDLAASLSGFFSEGNVAIPRNLALEFAPYWLFGRPSLTAKAYEQGGWFNAVRTFTVSLATKQSTRQTMDAGGATTDRTDSDVGLGIRSRVFWHGLGKGAACTEQDEAVQAVEKAAQDVSASQILPEQEMADIKKTNPNQSDFAAEYTKRVALRRAQAQQLFDALEKARQTLSSKCIDLTASARGWSADVAGALGWDFPDSLATYRNGDLRAAAGWLTLAYAGESLTAALLGRYNGTQVGTAWQKDLDFGLRLVYKHNEFALSGEGISRFRAAGPGPDKTYKLDVAAEYKVAGETWITLTIGRSFDVGVGSSLFGVANVNVGFGSGPKSKT